MELNWFSYYFHVYDWFEFYYYGPFIVVAALVGYITGFLVATKLKPTEKAVLAATVLVVAIVCFTLNEIVGIFAITSNYQ